MSVDPRVAELDAISDPWKFHFALVKAWPEWLREAALRGIESEERQIEGTLGKGLPDAGCSERADGALSQDRPAAVSSASPEAVRGLTVLAMNAEAKALLDRARQYLNEADIYVDAAQFARDDLIRELIALCESLPLAPLAPEVEEAVRLAHQIVYEEPWALDKDLNTLARALLKLTGG